MLSFVLRLLKYRSNNHASGLAFIELAVSVPVILGIIFGISDNLVPLLIKQRNTRIAMELYLDQDVAPIQVTDIAITTSPLAAEPFQTIDQTPTALTAFFDELRDGFQRRNDGESSLFYVLGLLEIDRNTGLSTGYRIIENNGAKVTSVLGRDCADSDSVTANSTALNSYANSYFATLLAFKPNSPKGIKIYNVEFPRRTCLDGAGNALAWNSTTCTSVSYQSKNVTQYLPWIPVAFYRICEKPTQFVFDNDATVTLATAVKIMVGQS